MNSTKVKLIDKVRSGKKTDGENRLINVVVLETASMCRRCIPEEGGGGPE